MRAAPPPAARIQPAAGTAWPRPIPPHGARDATVSPTAMRPTLQAEANRSLQVECDATATKTTATPARPSREGSKARSSGAAPISNAIMRVARGLSTRAASPATNVTAPTTTASCQSG